MRVLLDENLDHRLRSQLGPHEVFTASYKGWDGFKNGDLLRAAEDDEFLTYSLPAIKPCTMSRA